MPTIPGPTEQTTASNPCAGGPGERGRDSHGLHVAVEARPRRNRGLDEPAPLQHPKRVRQRDGQRPAGQLHVRHPNALADSGHGRSHLRVKRAADDRHPVQGLRQLAVLLDEARRGLERRVREGHHVRARLDLQPEAARQVRVEHVEPARSQLQLTRLDVDDHLVPDLDGAGQARVRDAGLAVDLDPREPFDLLHDGGDGSAPQAKRHSSRARRRRAPG